YSNSQINFHPKNYFFYKSAVENNANFDRTFLFFSNKNSHIYNSRKSICFLITNFLSIILIKNLLLDLIKKTHYLVYRCFTNTIYCVLK
ncbi:hypothetical protein D3M74_00735, partial [Rodentibacter pneumotropicus]